MDQWALIGTWVGGIGTILSIIVAIILYSKNENKNRIRSTLQDFPPIRKEYEELILNTASLPLEEKELKLKRYMGEMERFATGINLGAYSIQAVDQMSGGMLIQQYKRYIKEFITARRALHHDATRPEKRYCQYEKMMKALYELRGEPWME